MDRSPARRGIDTSTDTGAGETTAVRPALADDLFRSSPPAVEQEAAAAPSVLPEDDLLADEEFMAPGGRRPSWLTRVLLALLICAVGVFVGVQVGRLAGGSSAAGAAAGGSGSARRFGPPRAGAPSGGGSAAPRSTVGSSAPAVQGEVTSVRGRALVVHDQQGVSRTVTVTDATTLTAPYGHRAVTAGDGVTVFGSRAADGSVNATSIVVR